MTSNRDRVLLHPDPLRLEQELVERIAARKESAAPGVPRILVLAPTRRQVQRMRKVLAGAFGGLLGVEVLTHLTLARRVVEATAERVPALAGRPLREEITKRLLDARGGRLGTYADGFPSVVGTLTGLLGELREAGITAEALHGEAVHADERELADLLEDLDRALEALRTADAPATDRAGFTRLAVAALPHTPPFHEVFQIGAYDLVGMNLDLVRAIPADHGVTWLVPADATAPSWKFARDFLSEFVDVKPEPLDDREERAFVRAAREFRSRDGDAPAPLPEGAVQLIHAQGPEAELTLAARAILRDLGEGLSPDDVAVVARTLEPYASVAQSVFERHGLRVDSSLGFPLSREPKAQTFLTLARALARDFQRQDVIDLTRAGALQRPETENWAPNQWDRLSRRYRISGGKDAWTTRLPAQVLEDDPRDRAPEDGDLPDEVREAYERRLAEVAVLARFVDALATTGWPARGTGAEHAEALERAGKTHIRGWGTDAHDEPGVAERLGEALDGLRSLDAAAAAAGAVTGRDATARLTREEALEFLERTLTETRVPWASGGVRFLDVMQARGLPVKRLYFVGFNADLVPRRPREDVFLTDATRAKVRRATGRPLTVRAQGLDEEHLLQAQTAASIGDRLVLSWQRADAEGKSMAVSLALQEWTRLLPGGFTHRERVNADDPAVGPWRVPTHPAVNARALRTRFDLISPLEAVLITAEESPGEEAPDRILDLAGSCPGLDADTLRPGLALVGTVERFDDGDPRFDAIVGPDGGWKDGFSPSSLERLAGCPQQFFFRYRLRIRALDETSEEYRIDPLDLGLRIHDLLENVYRPLRNRQDPPRELVAFALDRLATEWETTFAEVRSTMSARYPGLWNALEASWLEELRRFVGKDLDLLREAGLAVEDVEPNLSHPITVRFPEGDREAVTFDLEGRLDRVARGAGQVVVADYKTGGNLEKWVEKDKVLQARKLQLPLYTRLAERQYPGEEVTAELIGLGPSFLPAKGFVRTGPVRLKDFDKLVAGFEETLAILVGDAREGRYPMNPDKGPCDYCEFRIACRRHHHPSKERVQGNPALEEFFLVQEKSSTKPLVADVREKRS